MLANVQAADDKLAKWQQSNSVPTENTLYGIWGSSSTDVFAVGVYGTIVHYDGSRWTEMKSGTDRHLNDIWGSSSNNVFAVGDSTILHYDGNRWSDINMGNYNLNFYGIWGSSDNNLFIVSHYSETILHYNGSSWTEMTTQNGDNRFEQHVPNIWGHSENDVFALDTIDIHHYDGNQWTAMNANNIISVIILFISKHPFGLLKYNYNYFSVVNPYSVNCLT